MPNDCRGGKEEFRNAFALQCIGRDEVPISEMAELLGNGESTIYKKVAKMKDEFKIENKIVKRQEPQENQGSEGTTDVNSTPRKKEGMKTRKANARKPKKNQASEAKKEGK